MCGAVPRSSQGKQVKKPAILTVTPGLVEFAFSEFYQTPSPLLTSRYCAFVRVHFCSEWYRLFSIVAR